MNRLFRLSVTPLLVVLLVTIQAHLPMAGRASGTPGWQAEWGGFNLIADFDILPDGRVLAVGSNLIVGDSIESGSRWRAIDGAEVPQYFTAISLIEGSGWAVSNACLERIERGRPLGCSPNPLGIFSLYQTQPGEGWALGHGSDGAVGFIRLTGSEFSYRQAATAGVPQDLWVDKSGDGWAAAAKGRMYRLRDGDWSVASTPLTRTVTLVAGQAPDDVWAAAGSKPGPPPIETPTWQLLHFDGQTWSVAQEEEGYGYAAIALGHGTGYLAGWEGELRRLEGGTWRRLEGRVNATRFQPVSSLKMLADGTALVATEGGGVFHVVDDRVEAVFVPRTMTGIWLVDNRGWAVGGGTALERTPDGGWRLMPADSQLNALTSLDGLVADDAWGVGRGGLIMHFDGVTWSSVASPTTIDLTRVRVMSPDLAWAAGSKISGGTVYSIALRYDGANWAPIWERSGNYETQIIDAAGRRANEPWVVSGWKLWRTEGGSWIDVGAGDAIWSVDVTDDGVYAGGEGNLYRYVDNTWRYELKIGGGGQIHGLRMRNGLVAAWYGIMYRLDHTSGAWRHLRGSMNPSGEYGVPYALYDAAPVIDSAGGAEHIFAAGAQASILSDLSANAPTTPTPPASVGHMLLFLPNLRNQP